MIVIETSLGMCDEYLKIEKMYNDLHYTIFIIVVQSFTGNEFFKGTSKFKSSNGILISSLAFPSYMDSPERVFFVRGCEHIHNCRPCICMTSEYADISKAVEEYNFERSKEVVND